MTTTTTTTRRRIVWKRNRKYVFRRRVLAFMVFYLFGIFLGWLISHGTSYITEMETSSNESVVEQIEKENATATIGKSHTQEAKVVKKEIKSNKPKNVDKVKKTDEIKNESVKAEVPSEKKSGYSDEDIMLLRMIVLAEVGTDNYEAKVAVCNVVLNRAKQRNQTIEQVIFAENQFTPANTKEMKIYFCDEFNQYRPITEEDITDTVIEAVNDAISGVNLIGNRDSFYVPEYCSQKEIKYRDNYGCDFLRLNGSKTVFHNWSK